jgi:hypothetical protein
MEAHNWKYWQKPRISLIYTQAQNLSLKLSILNAQVLISLELVLIMFFKTVCLLFVISFSSSLVRVSMFGGANIKPNSDACFSVFSNLAF